MLELHSHGTSFLPVLLLRPFDPSRTAGKGSRFRGHPRPRSTLIAYWWFRVLLTLIFRTARPCRRISSATARGTRKSGTGETFISSGEDVPVAAWPTVRSHFRSGLPPLVFGSVLLVSCCMVLYLTHRDGSRRMHHPRELPVKRVSLWLRTGQPATYKRCFIGRS